MKLRILMFSLLVVSYNAVHAMDDTLPIKRSASLYAGWQESSENLGRELVDACRDSIVKTPMGKVIVKEYLKQEPDFTVCDDKGSALMWVCRLGLRGLAQAMIGCGAKLEVVSELGYTPLHAAVELGDITLVKLLLDRHARINASSSDGATALHRAAMKGDCTLASFLIKRGALLNVQTVDGYTALHYAVQEGHDKVVSLLLECQASMELVDSFKRTPLHIAAWLGDDYILALLIDHGANINAQECELTPLDVAEHMGHGTVVLDLIYRGASRFLVDKEKLHEKLLLPLDEIEVQEGCLQISPQSCEAE